MSVPTKRPSTITAFAGVVTRSIMALRRARLAVSVSRYSRNDASTVDRAEPRVGHSTSAEAMETRRLEVAAETNAS